MRTSALTPARDRPDLPQGYIKRTPRGMLAWRDVERILRGFSYLWIATSGKTGAPHLVQQWGVWIDGTLYFEGSDRTRWARHLARDPRLAFGMQVEHQAAYGEARVDVIRPVPHELAVRVAKEYARKYSRVFGYRPEARGYEEGHIFRARPSKIIAFDVKRFNTSAARFTFQT